MCTETVNVREIGVKNEKKLHKQPREYLKNAAHLVGRDYCLPMPFDTNNKIGCTDAADLKESISKKTAITGHCLMRLWQKHKNSDGWLEIRNLSAISKPLQTTNERLKLYLVCMGGYQYPVIRLEKRGGNKSKLSITHEKLCHIEFIFDLTDSEIQQADHLQIGSRHLHFIKGHRISCVRFKPTDATIEQLEGRGLGNVLVSDSFVALCLGLSDMAYKLLCYTGSNKPRGKIGFDKIVRTEHLNLEGQIKQQGRPRILESIMKGLEELKDTGHIKEWRYDEQTGMLEWEYSDRVIRHSDFFGRENETSHLYD